VRRPTRVDAVSTAVRKLVFVQMSQEDAEEIADWRYDPPYDFYDARADESDLANLLNPVRREDRGFSARDEAGELVGFFTYARDADAIVVGLGLRPDLTGRGLGAWFVEQGLDFGRARFAPQRFRLNVAEFNERAVKVYERAGFVRTRSFQDQTNDGSYPFLEMERPA
jgi:[ribosomal protein S18]-alanine N-acetyltransferase